MQRNCAIEAYRFLFMLVICVFHFIAQYRGLDGLRYLRGGYLGVEFFFITSGFFLALKLDGIKCEESCAKQAFEIFLKRVKRLYPSFFLSFLSYTMLWIFMRNFKCGGDFINYLYDNVWSLLFLNGIGIPGTKVFAGNIWYLSSLCVGMYFFIFLALKARDLFFGFIVPFVCVVGYPFIGHLHGSLSVQELWTGFIYGGILRGFCDLCCGGGGSVFGEISFPKNFVSEKRFVRMCGDFFRVGSFSLPKRWILCRRPQDCCIYFDFAVLRIAKMRNVLSSVQFFHTKTVGLAWKHYLRDVSDTPYIHHIVYCFNSASKLEVFVIAVHAYNDFFSMVDEEIVGISRKKTFRGFPCSSLN